MKTPIENILANYFAREASQEEIATAEKFRMENPDEFAIWKEAYQLSIFEEKTFNIEAAKQKVMQMAQHKKTQSKTRVLQRWLKVAAIFAGLLLVGTSFYYYSQSLNVFIQNNTASLMELTLPDGSEITLDKNAELSYRNNFMGQFQREVSMSGRAFFHVSKDAAHPFKVNSGDITVTVLGTRFTVNELKGHTQVFLTEGKVRVESGKTRETVLISHPGDQVITTREGSLLQNKVNAALYASWTSNRIHFNNCTVREVVQFLDDSYGIRVNISNKNALNRRLYGSAPADDEQLIIEALSQITQTDIESK